MNIVNRRCFLLRNGRAMLALPFCSSAGAWLGMASPAEAQNADSSREFSAEMLSRVGVTTSTFRFLFAPPIGARQPEGWPPPLRQDLTLLETPRFVAEQTGLRNLELWSPHFAEESIAYCQQVREAAAAAGVEIINVQVDTRYNLSHPDRQERQRSLQLVKQWMDRAKATGSPSARVNTGGAVAGEAFDVKITGDSFRQLTEYGHKIGIKVLAENHGGHSSRLENLVELLDYVNDPNCRLVFDWGNAVRTTEERVAAIRQFKPYLELISAKGRGFDQEYRHTTFEVEPLVRELEKQDFNGYYAIEIWNSQEPIPDPARATRSFAREIGASLRAKAAA